MDKPKRQKTGGRKVGVPNRASAAREARIAEDGSTPLQVMVKSYRWFEMRAGEAMEKASNATRNKDKLLKEADTLARQMSDESSKAAPYIHAKLATLQTNVNLTGKLTLEQLLASTIPDKK